MESSKEKIKIDDYEAYEESLKKDEELKKLEKKCLIECLVANVIITVLVYTISYLLGWY